MNLDELPTGSSGTIMSVAGDGRQARELLSLGLVPGVPVKVLRRAFGGDPVEVHAGGHPLCLRRKQSSRIRVTALPDSP